MLLIRADASVSIGTGHIMRCLALAQAWQDKGGRVGFACIEIPTHLKQRLHSENISVYSIDAAVGTRQDATCLQEILTSTEARHLILDGYRLTDDYCHHFQDSRVTSLLIDDYGQCQHYSTSLVLNQNVNASERIYSNRSSDTHLLLGTRFSLLRREFRTRSQVAKDIAPIAKNIVIAFGGSDPLNLTSCFLKALNQIKDIDLTIRAIVGGSNQNFNEVSHLAETSRHSVGVFQNIPDMTDPLSWADFVISAPGTLTWETFYFGTPSYLCGYVANQWLGSEQLSAKFAVVKKIENRNVISEFIPEIATLLRAESIRRELSKNAQSLIDGLGANRVCDQLLAMSPLKS